MKASHCFKPASSFQVGSVGSLYQQVDRIPLAFSSPAGFSAIPIEVATLFRMCTGFQPISAALRIACAAYFEIVTLKNRSAPEDLRLTICESTVGSVVSYGTSRTIIDLALAPSPSLRPLT